MSLTETLLRGDAAPAPRTLVDVFAEAVTAFPDATALDSGQERLTYAELAEAAEELAGELATRGVLNVGYLRSGQARVLLAALLSVADDSATADAATSAGKAGEAEVSEARVASANVVRQRWSRFHLYN